MYWLNPRWHKAYKKYIFLSVPKSQIVILLSMPYLAYLKYEKGHEKLGDFLSSVNLIFDPAKQLRRLFLRYFFLDPCSSKWTVVLKCEKQKENGIS